MAGLVAALFAFLQAELAVEEESRQRSCVEVLFCSRFLGVFPRDALMRLGVAPPTPLPPLDEAAVSSPTLPWQTLEAVVADDMPFLFLLLSRNAVGLDLKLASPHAAFPYMVSGDSLYKYVERYPCWWTRKLFAFWRMRQAASGGGSGSGGETDLRRMARSSLKTMPSRRGSYAIMKRDLEKVREEQEAALLLIVHLGENERTVNVETSSAKKARHLVYEIGERYGMDLEAWGLKDKAGNFLDDYKSLKQSGVRSGDELSVALRYKALQFKTVTVLVHAVNADGSYAIVRVPLDPYTTVEELLKRVARHAGDEIMLPLVVGGKLCGVWLDPVQTIASYSAAEARWAWQAVEVQKPLLLGSRSAVMRYGVANTVETDARIAVWWNILEHFGEWTTGHKRRGELHAALALGVPPCLRFAVWDRALRISELCSANAGLFEKLADLDLSSAEEEAVVEKIDRDLDRTMPYHPFFRTRLCKGQVLMLQVLRAYSLFDKEIGYCQGLNFVCATLLTVMDASRAFWAITILLNRFGLRSNFVPGMLGLHDMLSAFDQRLFARELPELHAFFDHNGLISASFATEWFLTLFAACGLSGESTLLIWDVLVFRGAEFLPMFGLSLLQVKQREMMENPERAVDVLRGAFKEDSNATVQSVVAVALERYRKKK